MHLQLIQLMQPKLVLLQMPVNLHFIKCYIIILIIEKKINYQKIVEAVGLEENGGWTVENARRRLNEFCMEERISCEFETSSQG